MDLSGAQRTDSGLWSASITDKGLETIGQLRNLRELNLLAAKITDAVKADWKFTAAVDFINTNDLGTQPLDPEKNYLVRIKRTDAEKHDAVFLALVAGWKQKKGEVLVVEEGAVTNIPAEQELASIMVDPKSLSSDGSALVVIYAKHLQDYLKNVESGKIKDKATADRLYAGRSSTQTAASSSGAPRGRSRARS